MNDALIQVDDGYAIAVTARLEKVGRKRVKRAKGQKKKKKRKRKKKGKENNVVCMRDEVGGHTRLKPERPLLMHNSG